MATDYQNMKKTRLNRDHVINVRVKKDRYTVVMTDEQCIDDRKCTSTWEIPWEKWVQDKKDEILKNC